MPENEQVENGFQKCGVSFLETVMTPYGVGIVQGIIREEDGLRVIVSHDPKILPQEMIPYPCLWKLMYYKPEEITKEANNGRKGKIK